MAQYSNGRPVSAPGSSGRKAGQKKFTPTVSNPPVTPPGDTVVTPEMIAFKDAFLASAEPTHPAAIDSAQQREMVLLTNVLTARANCTHVAVQDGNWTDSTTWLKVADDTFEVPTAGAKIGIPQGITVTMNNNTTTVYDYLRVDGKITFAVGQNTQLFIDTIVCCCTSEWEQGTTVAPITSAYTSTITFPDGGDLDPSVDKLLIGRGWITMGKVRVCGASKDHWALTSQTLSASATTLTLDPIPTGWAVGDSLHITGTERTGAWRTESTDQGLTADDAEWADYQGEDVVITDITGTTITFTPALTNTHQVRNETGFTDLTYPIVNFSRNIVFQSPEGTAIHRRGHTMWMGDDTDVRWAMSTRNGRTIKFNYENANTSASVDATNDTARIALRGGDVDWLPTSNVRGRYNWHHHRTGVQDSALESNFVGLAAEWAPGWLYSHHQGRANFDKCVGRYFQGAGMMAEVGSETGAWTDCFMAGIASVSGAVLRGSFSWTEKGAGGWNGNDGDFGRFGSAFWLKSRDVAMNGNVAAGCNSGFVWLSRFGVPSAFPNGNWTPEPRVFYGLEGIGGTIGFDRPIIREFKDCTGIGTVLGVVVIKAGSDQGHDLRTNIIDNTFWNVIAGIHLEYTSHYTATNNRCLSVTPKVTGPTRGYNYGFEQGNAVWMFLWDSNLARGFHKGLHFSTSPVARTNTQCRNYAIGNTFPDCTLDIVITGDDNADISLWTQYLTLKTEDDYSDVDPTWAPDGVPTYTSNSGGSGYIFEGNLTNEFETALRQLGTVGVSYEYGAGPRAAGVAAMLTRYGYYTYSGDNYLLVPDLLSRKRVNPATRTIETRYCTTILKVSGSGVSGILLNFANYTNNGAMPSPYSDAMVAGTYVVYEDIKGTDGLYEGL